MKKIKEALKEVLIHKEDDIEAQKIIADLRGSNDVRNIITQKRLY